MKTKSRIDAVIRRSLCSLALLLVVAGCQREGPPRWQGYLEGEYVYVASSAGGRLEHLSVRRGQTVEAGGVLFALDPTIETANLRETEERLSQVQSRLMDLRKGQRPSEVAALSARIDRARSARDLAKLEAQRLARLFDSQTVSTELYDQARFAARGQEAQVRELEAQLATAQLGARIDTVHAAEAEVAAAQTAVDRARWSVRERSPTAPEAALVYDTLFREGEMVMAGQPVVALLPPANLKIRFFVPESARATLAVGDTVQVSFTDETTPTPAEVVYLSPQAEFTPPVLYNRENRAKLVFMIEAVFAPDAGVELRPGQPVDVAR